MYPNQVTVIITQDDIIEARRILDVHDSTIRLSEQCPVSRAATRALPMLAGDHVASSMRWCSVYGPERIMIMTYDLPAAAAAFIHQFDWQGFDDPQPLTFQMQRTK